LKNMINVNNEKSWAMYTKKKIIM